MGLLVGLPLKIFHFLFVVVRFAWPVLLALLVYVLIRRIRRKHTKQDGTGGTAPAKEPKFHGPVYTVDYEEVDDTEDKP